MFFFDSLRTNGVRNVLSLEIVLPIETVYSFELTLVFDRFGKSLQICLAFNWVVREESFFYAGNTFTRPVCYGYKIAMFSWPERKAVTESVKFKLVNNASTRISLVYSREVFMNASRWKVLNNMYYTTEKGLKRIR